MRKGWDNLIPSQKKKLTPPIITISKSVEIQPTYLKSPTRKVIVEKFKTEKHRFCMACSALFIGNKPYCEFCLKNDKVDSVKRKIKKMFKGVYFQCILYELFKYAIENNEDMNINKIEDICASVLEVINKNERVVIQKDLEDFHEEINGFDINDDDESDDVFTKYRKSIKKKRTRKDAKMNPDELKKSISDFNKHKKEVKKIKSCSIN